MNHYNDHSETVWSELCQRCYKETSSHIMSMYSTKLICMECKSKEEDRDDYEEARSAATEAVRAGNYNFEGIGEPCG